MQKSKLNLSHGYPRILRSKSQTIAKMPISDLTTRPSQYHSLPGGSTKSSSANDDKPTATTQHCENASALGLIKCKDCFKTFTKRMHYKYRVLFVHYIILPI
jgi:hypothetical protein